MANYLSAITSVLGKKKPEDFLTPTSESGIMPAAPPITGAPALPTIEAPPGPMANSGSFGRAAEEALRMQPPAGVGGPDLSGVGVDLPERPWSTGKTPYSPMAQQEDQFMLKGMKPGEDGKPQFKRSWVDALKNAGIGFIQGAASNPDNPLAGGFGGAAAGGVITGIDPMRGRRYQFETMERPRIEADEQRNQAWQAQLGKAAEAAIRNRILENQARSGELDIEDRPALRTREERESRSRELVNQANARRISQPPTPARATPHWQAVVGSDGRQTYVDLNDPANRGKSFSPIPREGSPDQRFKAAERDLENQEGSVEQIAQDTMAGREAMLRSRLSKEEQAALANPDSADPEILNNARNAYSKLYNEEYQRVLDRTRGERRKGAAGRAGGSSGAAPAAPSKPSVGSRSLSSLKSLLK